jgi:hypothetical protein
MANEGCSVSKLHTIPVPPRAYTLENNPLPFSRSTWFRWEKRGVIPPLLRIGGKTLVQSTTIDDLIGGKIVPPPNHGHIKAHEPRVRPRGGHPSKLPKPSHRPKPAADAAE